MEEAQGYHALADEFKRSQEDIAKIVGKSRSHVANMMRLTKLPAEVQAYISSGQLSAGHARALIGVPDPAAAAKRIVEEGLNVRQAEALAHVEGVPERKTQKRARWQDQGSRHARAGKTGQRRARSRGQRRSSRSRRHCRDPLPRSRSARRHCAKAGSEVGFAIVPGRLVESHRNNKSFTLAVWRSTAIVNSVRCAITAASGACLRMSSAAVASSSITAAIRVGLK